jgi:hypothetical protein
MEVWPKVRSLDTDFTDQLRSELSCDTQVLSSSQTVANPASIVLVACSTCYSVARADVAVCRGLLRQET